MIGEMLPRPRPAGRLRLRRLRAIISSPPGHRIRRPGGEAGQAGRRV